MKKQLEAKLARMSRKQQGQMGVKGVELKPSRRQQGQLGVKGAELKPSAPATMRVVVYEGAKAGSTKFDRLCVRKTNATVGGGVSRSYIRGLDSKIEDHPSSTFRLAVLKGQQTVALTHCTLYARMPGFKQQRVVFVDLVCSDERAKGAGSILLTELENYARSIGARVVALQSLPSPQVRGAYSRRGFVRGLGNRSNEATRLARQRFANLRSMASSGNFKRLLKYLNNVDDDNQLCLNLEEQAKLTKALSPAFLEALAGEFYPAYNSLFGEGDSVAMYKQVQQPASTARVWWDTPDYAEIVQPRQRTLATYYRYRGASRFTRAGRADPQQQPSSKPQPPPVPQQPQPQPQQPSSRSWIPAWWFGR